MSTPKAPPLPVIIIANNLLDGDVVFRTHDGWTLDHREAAIAHEQGVADALLADGKASAARQKVVDVYPVDVTIDTDGAPIPRHYREKQRILGPSNRTDLGKQADFRKA